MTTQVDPDEVKRWLARLTSARRQFDSVTDLGRKGVRTRGAARTRGAMRTPVHGEGSESLESVLDALA
jgi:hypothetical protein